QRPAAAFATGAGLALRADRHAGQRCAGALVTPAGRGGAATVRAARADLHPLFALGEAAGRGIDGLSGGLGTACAGGGGTGGGAGVLSVVSGIDHCAVRDGAGAGDRAGEGVSGQAGGFAGVGIKGKRKSLLPADRQASGAKSVAVCADASGFRPPAESLSLAWPRESNQREGHPDIRPRLRRGSLLPVPLRGYVTKGRPFPFAPPSASMPRVPLRNTSTRPTDGERSPSRLEDRELLWHFLARRTNQQTTPTAPFRRVSGTVV